MGGVLHGAFGCAGWRTCAPRYGVLAAKSGLLTAGGFCWCVRGRRLVMSRSGCGTTSFERRRRQCCSGADGEGPQFLVGVRLAPRGVLPRREGVMSRSRVSVSAAWTHGDLGA